MNKEKKPYAITVTPQMIYGIEGILDKLVKDKGYIAKMDNIYIVYNGKSFDSRGECETFTIVRVKDD